MRRVHTRLQKVQRKSLTKPMIAMLERTERKEHPLMGLMATEEILTALIKRGLIVMDPPSVYRVTSLGRVALG